MNHLGTAVFKLLVAVSVIATFIYHVSEVQRHWDLSLAHATIFLFEVRFISFSPLIFMVRMRELGEALLIAVDVLTIKNIAQGQSEG